MIVQFYDGSMVDGGWWMVEEVRCFVPPLASNSFLVFKFGRRQAKRPF